MMPAALRALRLLAINAALTLQIVRCAGDADPPLQDRIRLALHRIAERKSAKYNCSVSIAIKTATISESAAYGTIDFSTGRQANASDAYAWGSVTKMLTGAGILRLASQGKFSLDDTIAPLVDPILSKMAKSDPSMQFSSLADLWGAHNVSNTTVRQLLSMTSRVPDFDTAVPDFGKHAATDSLRKTLFEKGSVGMSPRELLAVPWVAHNWNEPCKRFAALVLPFCYSSTGFMLLGLILASFDGASSPAEFDQRSLLPPELRGKFQFPMAGAPPQKYTSVHGYDRTSYNMPVKQLNDFDVSGVGGVFSGWTASNTVADASAVADMVWHIYGPPKSVAPAQYVRMMPPQGISVRGVAPYGLATCQFDLFTGHVGKYGVAYGHSGATYGYQSLAVYFPTMEMSIAIATNIETDYQQQPADTLCSTYSEVAGLILGQRSRCFYKQVQNYYISGCVCTPFRNVDTELLDNVTSVFV
eukprot:TRINITY_DN26771_c0_g1_i1.p1 TRINITY_DN26771_c0_g1~~TRINITY_DN26771_c0_g1_i1.p1  ORF type:complete len:483 (+),score=52.62 TRINITY_DN26771_c0_g1_i1:36-1451(+)